MTAYWRCRKTRSDCELPTGGLESDTPRPILISRPAFHGRSEGIAPALDIPAWFSNGGPGPRPAQDLRRWSRTWRILREQQPAVVIVMQPPVMALWSRDWSTAATIRALSQAAVVTMTRDENTMQRAAYELTRPVGATIAVGVRNTLLDDGAATKMAEFADPTDRGAGAVIGPVPRLGGQQLAYPPFI